MVEEILAARGIVVSHETIRQWSEKFGREFSNRIRRRAPVRGDKWRLDEVVIAFRAQPGGALNLVYCFKKKRSIARDASSPTSCV